MERTEILRLQAIANCCLTFVLGSFLIIGCGEEPGRVRVKQAEVVGTYEAKFDGGREVLELRSDHTYIQDFTAENTSIHHTGVWKLENHFFNGSDILLISAVVSENDSPRGTQRTGDRTLNVHNRSGKTALALNETADWYFVRMR